MYIDKKIIAMKKELLEDLRKIGLPTLVYKKTNGIILYYLICSERVFGVSTGVVAVTAPGSSS